MSEMCRALTGLGVILRRVTDCELIVHSFAQFSFVTRAADKPMPSLQEKECLIWSLDSLMKPFSAVRLSSVTVARSAHRESSLFLPLLAKLDIQLN